MAEGWLMNSEDRWTYRFQRDEKAWVREPRVFVDMCRPMPDGSPALLKTREHMRREQAESMWKYLVRRGGRNALFLYGDLMQDSEVTRCFIADRGQNGWRITPLNLNAFKESGEGEPP